MTIRSQARSFSAVLVASVMVMGSFGVFAISAATPSVLPVLTKLSSQVLSAVFAGDRDDRPMRVIVETNGHPSAELAKTIQALGGSVAVRFQYTPALAAYLPADRIPLLAQRPDVKRIYLDALVRLAVAPRLGSLDVSTVFDVDRVDGDSEAVDFTAADIPRLAPANFFNSALSGVTPGVLAATDSGANTILAIIDTGINSRHAAFTPKNPDGTSTRVVGGRDVSCDGELSVDFFCTPGVGRPSNFVPLPGFDRSTNNFHGSFVAAVTAGSGAVSRGATSLLVTSIELWTGAPLPPGPTAGTKLIPLIGIAPAANLFILKVFDHTGLGVPSSFVINAINAAVDAKAGGVDIDVINMSLGGATLFDGQDLTDSTVDFATSQGILSVSAAGNDGPASMTVSSPGSAQTGIAVAAAADPVQVRIRRDQQLGLGNGALAFVSDKTQVIFFSSRGPTSDGRAKPDIIASGTFILSAFAQGFTTALAFASGTSFSTPAVAGAAALLNSFAEKNGLDAAPFDIKQALRKSADKEMVPSYPREARGKGFLDVAGALEQLKSQAKHKKLGDTERVEFGDSLERPETIEFEDNHFSKKLSLSPGHIREFIFKVPRRDHRIVEQIHLRVTVRDLGDNPLAGNPDIGGNSVSVYTQSAKRTTRDAHVNKVLVTGAADFTITDDETLAAGDLLGFSANQLRSHIIEPGFFKVLVDTDWRSFDRVKFRLEIDVTFEKRPRPEVSLKGTIGQDEVIFLGPFALKADDVIELSWKHDWSRYPTSDVDFFLIDAETGDLISFGGATLNSPERVRLHADATVFVILFGFEINPPGKTEKWRLRIFE